jgi:hypothetical protein
VLKIFCSTSALSELKKAEEEPVLNFIFLLPAHPLHVGLESFFFGMGQDVLIHFIT